MEWVAGVKWAGGGKGYFMKCDLTYIFLVKREKPVIISGKEKCYISVT